MPEDLTSNVQIVANYIKALNEGIIDKNDLYIDKVSSSDFENYRTTVKAEVLSQSVCQKLIFDKITLEEKIEKPNYYQITSFIDVLAAQLRKFSMNFILSVYLFKMNKIS